MEPRFTQNHPDGHHTLNAIDVHAHYVPADYCEALQANGFTQPDGMPAIPAWTPEAHLEVMDRLKIRTSMLSVSSPGVSFGADTEYWARSVNESGAKIVSDHPDRFGFFASLPLPDVDAALQEIRYAFDVLKAHGVVLMTHFDGIYLGDERFDPIYAELDRRRAVVFIHPTSPTCFEHTSLGYPRPMIEFIFDTTRAITNLTVTGTLAKYPNMRIIVPHAGAALPILADRIASLAAMLPLGGNKPGDIDVLGTLQNLHYEVGAGAPFPRHVSALLDLVDSTQLLFGTDFPFGPVAAMEKACEDLLNTKLLNTQEVQGILHHNALQLFPRLNAN